jgi:serine/threonine protein kinase/tetratricopeptide (TPR) repeat protein
MIRPATVHIDRTRGGSPVEKASADPLVGRTVAQYEVVGRLGGGGMGLVYAARDTRLGRRVALKFLPPQWSHDESAKERFIREAQAASATDHPNICTIHDIGTTDDEQLFIVMAHYDGETLKKRLERGLVGVEEAIDIAAQVAEGLAKAHAQGVIHRDIKPGNLMLTEDGVKILDFGLAKFADARFKLTLEGSTVGTIAYMSPEQVRGEEADARSDIWALGAVLYEMLAGHVPFKGGYPEAIAHAIKNDVPAPLRTSQPDISEALEQLVFRALHKDPAVRFQTARDLARALRRAQGRTLPIDLRIEPFPDVTSTLPSHVGSPPWWKTRSGAAVAAAMLAATIGTSLWVFAPIERVPVAVAPVVNQTGDSELEAYRLGLTQELIASLVESHHIRVLPYDRLLQILRRFRAAGRDVSSREAIQALTANSGARVVIIPTLLYENDGWKARVEFLDTTTATSRASDETDPVVSSLKKEAAYGLMPQLALRIQGYFAAVGPRRASIADFVRTLAGRGPLPPATRLRTLDAAAAFEQGLDAFEQQDYSVALRAFRTATERDPRSPLLFAWQTRVARMMRLDKETAEAATQALRLITDQMPAQDRRFVQAVAAESRRDAATAEALYRELVIAHPDAPGWVMELAAFQDRQLRTADAIETYHQALRLDERLVRPHLELCRLYGPLRLNDLPRAKQHGEIALARYRALGAPAGEAQTLWCLTDVQGLGDEAARAEAVRHADAALRIFENLHSEYNLSRAYNYAANAATRQGRLADAASLWERSLASARTAGNVGLEALVLTNLGSIYANLGNPERSIEYRQQGYTLLEALGEEQQAAMNQANRASLVIAYGGDLDTAFRDIRNALAVFRKLGDANYEVFSLRAIAAYHSQAGRHAEAERESSRALAIARERNLEDGIVASTVDHAQSRFDRSDYAEAAKLLAQVLGNSPGPASTEARIRLGRAYARLGDFEAARAALDQAGADLRTRRETGLIPLFGLATGELAYESGRLREARTHFAAASALWTDTLPDAASVEARLYLGLVDALDGRRAQAVAAIRACLAQARAMGRFSLEQRSRVFLARIAVTERHFDDALRILDEIPPDDASRTIGRELRAQVHYWRSRALAGRGDRAGAATEASAARGLIEQLRAPFPERYRSLVLARPDIHFPNE